MKAISIETVNGKSVITTQTITPKTTVKRLFRKSVIIPEKIETRRFIAAERIVERYWRWLELPDKTLVPDQLSFQLDAWLADEQK